MLDNFFLHGFKVYTPNSRDVDKYFWYESLRTYIKEKVWWVDPMEAAVANGQCIEDKVNRIFYMSEASKRQLHHQMETRRTNPFT